ncbi:MAG: ABC transporter ATP-binding protein/permease, partial [Oscillospiraceae bacterium]|nr:ABC transporter ATP-binding protein/permease [Oscillospiraceae bacterium]
MSQNRTLKEEFAMVLEGYKILLKIDGRFIWIPIIKSLFNAFLPFVNLFMSAKILTELTGKKDLKTLIIYAAVTVSLNLIANVVKRFIETKENVYLSEWWNKLNLFFNDINNNMQYEHLENPETRILRDKIYQAQHTVGGGFAALYWNLGGIVDGLFTVIFAVPLTAGMFAMKAAGDFSGIVGFINSPYSMIIILAAIIINTAVSIWCRGKEMGEEAVALEDMEQNARIANYYNGSIYNLTGAMDIKIYKQAPIILEEVKIFGENAPYLKICEKIKYKYRSIQIISDAAANIAVYAYVAAKAFIKTFGIGQFLQYTGAVSRFVSGISRCAYTLADYPHNNIYIKNILDYINMPNNMYQGTISVEKRDDNEYDIEFRNVSFKYPGTDAYALKNLSLKFNIGQRMAVVGQNGSGKTTMIKLLCRLYDPTEGVITLNGFDIR